MRIWNMKKTPLRKYSSKIWANMIKYRKERLSYMKDHPSCEVCGDPSVMLHHKKGRGIYLSDKRYFLATCVPCHDRIHRSPGWARSQGFMLDRIGKL